MEAGDSQWMRDSISLLKSVLCFDIVRQEPAETVSPFMDEGLENGLLSTMIGSHPIVDRLDSLRIDEESNDIKSPFEDEQKSPTPTRKEVSEDVMPQKRPPIPMRLSTFGSSSIVTLTAKAGVLQEARTRTFIMPSHLRNTELLE